MRIKSTILAGSLLAAFAGISPSFASGSASDQQVFIEIRGLLKDLLTKFDGVQWPGPVTPPDSGINADWQFIGDRYNEFQTGESFLLECETGQVMSGTASNTGGERKLTQVRCVVPVHNGQVVNLRPYNWGTLYPINLVDTTCREGEVMVGLRYQADNRSVAIKCATASLNGTDIEQFNETRTQRFPLISTFKWDCGSFNVMVGVHGSSSGTEFSCAQFREPTGINVLNGWNFIGGETFYEKASYSENIQDTVCASGQIMVGRARYAGMPQYDHAPQCAVPEFSGRIAIVSEGDWQPWLPMTNMREVCSNNKVVTGVEYQRDAQGDQAMRIRCASLEWQGYPVQREMQVKDTLPTLEIPTAQTGSEASTWECYKDARRDNVIVGLESTGAGYTRHTCSALMQIGE